jgi:hypothetical protein
LTGSCRSIRIRRRGAEADAEGFEHAEQRRQPRVAAFTTGLVVDRPREPEAVGQVKR